MRSESSIIVRPSNSDCAFPCLDIAEDEITFADAKELLPRQVGTFQRWFVEDSFSERPCAEFRLFTV